MLLEWMLCPSPADAAGAPLDPTLWQLMDWGARGTPDQCRLAAWVAQQRYLRCRGSLSAAATVRLEVRCNPRRPAFQRGLPFGRPPAARGSCCGACCGPCCGARGACTAAARGCCGMCGWWTPCGCTGRWQTVSGDAPMLRYFAAGRGQVPVTQAQPSNRSVCHTNVGPVGLVRLLVAPQSHLFAAAEVSRHSSVVR